MEQTKNIERFRLEKVCKALEAVARQVKYLKDSINKQHVLIMEIEKVIESYRKTLELIKDGIGNVETESEHGKGFISEAQKVLGTLIENLPNVQKMYEDLHANFEVEKDCKNDAYFFILESGNFYKYKQWHFNEKKGDLQSTLEKFWANNMNAPQKKGKK